MRLRNRGNVLIRGFVPGDPPDVSNGVPDRYLVSRSMTEKRVRWFTVDADDIVRVVRSALSKTKRGANRKPRPAPSFGLGATVRYTDPVHGKEYTGHVIDNERPGKLRYAVKLVGMNGQVMRAGVGNLRLAKTTPPCGAFTHRFKVGDKVRVVSGRHKDRIGEVRFVSDDATVPYYGIAFNLAEKNGVLIDDKDLGPVLKDVPIGLSPGAQAAHQLKVGDVVQVIAGIHEGRVGEVRQVHTTDFPGGSCAVAFNEGDQGGHWIDTKDVRLHKPAETESSTCEGCDGSGIRPGATARTGLPVPEGYVVVQRCDTCAKYKSDLEAARAYGSNAHDRDTGNTGESLCLMPFPEFEMKVNPSFVIGVLERAGLTKARVDRIREQLFVDSRKLCHAIAYSLLEVEA